MPAPKRSPTIFMPAISGPSITSSGRFGGQPRLLGVGLDIVGDAVDERMRDPLVDRLFAPAQILRLGLLAARAAIALGDGEQALGGVGASVEHRRPRMASRSSGSIVS